MILEKLKQTSVIIALVAAVLSCGTAHAGNIDATDKYAWGTNAGWFNFNPAHGGGVTVYDDHLEGYVWAENIGWIRLGTHTAGRPHTYANTTDLNYGVNNNGSGVLSGYGWSKNAGWINFSPTHGGVTITGGSFNGYAWGENAGWIHFDNAAPAYNVVTTWTAIPNAPSGLTATAESQTVMNLNWNDNSSNETGFKIFRNSTLVSSTGADVTTYSDAGLTCGTTYNYEVKATNAFGDSASSAASGTAQCIPVITAQAAPLETPEDTALILDISHVTVTDPDSSVFTLSVSEGSNYTFSGNTVTPGSDFNGTLTVPVTVSDGTNTSDPWNLSVTVTPLNDAPVIAGQSDLSTPEDTAFTLAAGNLTITDPDSSVFTLTVQEGTDYTRTDNTVTPSPDFNGTLTVPVKVNDGEAESDTYLLSITVTAVDDPPALSTPAEDVTVDEDAAPTTVNLSSVFTDPDDPVIEKSVLSNSNPALVSATLEGDTLTLEYQEDQNGTAEIVIQAASGGQTAEDTLTVTVNPVDDAPVVAAPLPDMTASEADPDTTVNLDGVFSDIDNDASDMVMTAASSDASLVIAVAAGSELNLFFRSGKTGKATVTVTAWSGGKKVTDEFEISVGRRALTLSGRILYYRNNIPVPGIPVILEGTDIYTGRPFMETVHTDENGEYVFPDVPPGDHTLAPSERAPVSERPSATDASRIARHAAGSYEFDEHQKLAADVTGNGTISGTDASFVARCAAGVIPAVNDLGTAWKFDPPLLAISPDSDLENQDFTAAMLGDVSGNYGGTGSRKSYHNPGEVTEITAYRGDVLSVPVVLDDEVFLEGADIAAAFDKDVLAPQEVSLADGIPGDRGYQSVANITEEEIFLALFASEEPSPVSGTLVFLNFVVTGKPGSRSPVTLTRFDCNEIPAGPEYRESRESASLTGGFYINGAVSRDIRVRVRTGYDLARHDLNGDGKIGMKDAFYGLKQGDVEGVIRALQCAAGIE
ncbi:Ig-like domain-containing protein [Desulfococcaceae bacterium HSG8]|nr:Ig-like domain-containing protein [Desulfococcaceae bacterium HSG8]